MKLSKLLRGIQDWDIKGNTDLEIKGLSYDSRNIKPGYMFVALKGSKMDGHEYINIAIEKGARAVLIEQEPITNKEVTFIKVPDSRSTLSELSSTFYNRPFENLNMIGITGTNGKTTTSYLLDSILSDSGAKTGVIGTINYRYSDKVWPAPVTTPESLDLMRILREMDNADVSDVIMEVSSHALDQGRTGKCPFRVAVFTNLSRDHLDYHNNMEEYFKAKSILFKGLSIENSDHDVDAVINRDDPKAEELIRMTKARVWTYGFGPGSMVRAESILTDINGIRAKLITPSGEIEIHSSLIGRVNVYNILAASTVALSLGIDSKHIKNGIKKIASVPGRLELVPNNRALSIIVDYAHTPDALEKAIETLRPLSKGRIITLFGCGGDRDKGKRAQMGEIAGLNSDYVFITSDNPRTEDPELIIKQIEEGVKRAGLEKIEPSLINQSGTPGYWIHTDRKKAINKTIEISNNKDMILIAGKGHEDYQILGNQRIFFDDRKIAALAAS